MKPKKNSLRWRLPNLDESDYIWLRDKFLEVVGPHESLSEQQIKDGRIYILGDPQADAVDRYKDELSKKIKELFEETK